MRQVCDTIESLPKGDQVLVFVISDTQRKLADILAIGHSPSRRAESASVFEVHSIQHGESVTGKSF
jgi:hypothetical protein